IFAFLYVLSNGFGLMNITIPWMILFHGSLNAGVFGLLGVIGFSLDLPNMIYEQPEFPVSQIQRKYKQKEPTVPLNGLVDQMDLYFTKTEQDTLAPTIIDFYENTKDYQLIAAVRWHRWFKPFALIYKG